MRWQGHYFRRFVVKMEYRLIFCRLSLVSRETSKMLAVQRTDFNDKDHARTSKKFAAWSMS